MKNQGNDDSKINNEVYVPAEYDEADWVKKSKFLGKNQPRILSTLKSQNLFDKRDLKNSVVHGTVSHKSL